MLDFSTKLRYSRSATAPHVAVPPLTPAPPTARDDPVRMDSHDALFALDAEAIELGGADGPRASNPSHCGPQSPVAQAPDSPTKMSATASQLSKGTTGKDAAGASTMDANSTARGFPRAVCHTCTAEIANELYLGWDKKFCSESCRSEHACRNGRFAVKKGAPDGIVDRG